MKTHPVYSEADSVVNPRQDQWSRGKELSLIEIGVADEYAQVRCDCLQLRMQRLLGKVLIVQVQWNGEIVEAFAHHQPSLEKLT